MTAATMRQRTVGLHERYVAAPSGLYLPPEVVPEPKPVAIDLFAGAGGFSLGFHMSGWHVAAAVEIDIHAAATYLVNLGSPETRVHTLEANGRWVSRRAAEVGTFTAGSGWIFDKPDQQPVEHLYMGDVARLTGAQVLADLGMDPGQVGCIMGGPPCQGFSTAGKQNVMDPRNSLVFEFARLVLEVNPGTFVMENVPAIQRMVTAEGIPVLDALSHYLAAGGYAEYEALRRSLGMDPNARAGMHGSGRKAARATDAEAEASDDELVLW